MIPQTDITAAAASWQQQLRELIDSGAELLAMLGLSAAEVGFSEQAARDFALKLPRAFAAKMARADPADPLLLQVLASRDELLAPAGYSDDPVGETGAANRDPGIIHKYRGRALLVLSGGCAINCRYCFRRHFPYADNRNSRSQWRDALARIAGDRSISEIILSGGDPLLVADRPLAELVEGVAAIPHVQRLRVHTRLPVVIPERVTPGLVRALGAARLQPVVVVHSNHPRELDSAFDRAMARLRAAGITLLNQSVLLAGVNDSAATLAALSERLFAAGVLPYYLHQLDRVRGAAHFEVDDSRARALLAEVTALLPGYLVPRLVREEAGAASKTPLPPA